MRNKLSNNVITKKITFSILTIGRSINRQTFIRKFGKTQSNSHFPIYDISDNLAFNFEL